MAQRAEELIMDVAARQHGLVTRTQLLAAGVAADAIRWRVRARRLRPVHRGVYQVGPLVAPRAREMAAMLACGGDAVVSHRSAGLLWQVGAGHASANLVHITVSGGGRGRFPGIRVHRMTLRRQEVTTLDGIAVTTMARTIFDLASVSGARELRQTLARAARERETILDEVKVLIARYPGRRGVRVLRGLLEGGKPLGFTRSEAEERFLTLIRRTGLPHPEVNTRVEGCEVDFVWRSHRLVVEVDGFAYHASRVRFERDRRRDGMLATRGFHVIRVTWQQIVRESEAMLVRLAQVLALTGPGARRT